MLNFKSMQIRSLPPWQIPVCTFYVYNTLIREYALMYTYSPQSKIHITESYIMFLYPVVFHIYSTIPSPAEEPRINPSYILRIKTAMEA